jgi:hypothetical protein
VKATSDAASGAAGKPSKKKRNKRCSDRHGGEDVDEGTKQSMQRAARRTQHQQDEETSNAVRAAVGKTSARERNQRCSARRCGQDIGKRKK